MGFYFNQRGSFDNTERFLKRSKGLDIRALVESQAQAGARALAESTPAESGLAAESWDYEIVQNGRRVSIVWTNSNVENGFPVAIALQYGYATGTGGYVQGRDYINPTMKPIFDSIAETVWKAVKSG
jgi:hypothetical protein